MSAILLKFLYFSLGFILGWWLGMYLGIRARDPTVFSHRRSNHHA